MKNYIYKVKAKPIILIAGIFSAIMTALFVLVILVSIAEQDYEGLEVCYVVLGIFLLLGVFCFLDCRKGLYVVKEKEEYVYVPLIGKKRYINRDEIDSFYIWRTNPKAENKLYDRIICLDKAGKTIISIPIIRTNSDIFLSELKMGKANNMAASANIGFDKYVSDTLDLIQSMLAGERDIPTYTSVTELKKIDFELRRMMQERSVLRYCPSFFKDIVARWDFEDQLAMELYVCFDMYRSIQIESLPQGATQEDYDIAKDVMTNFYSDNGILHYDDNYIQSCVIMLLNFVYHEGKDYTAENCKECVEKGFDAKGIKSDLCGRGYYNLSLHTKLALEKTIKHYYGDSEKGADLLAGVEKELTAQIFHDTISEFVKDGYVGPFDVTRLIYWMI